MPLKISAADTRRSELRTAREERQSKTMLTRYKTALRRGQALALNTTTSANSRNAWIAWMIKSPRNLSISEQRSVNQIDIGMQRARQLVTRSRTLGHLSRSSASRQNIIRHQRSVDKTSFWSHKFAAHRVALNLAQVNTFSTNDLVHLQIDTVSTKTQQRSSR